MVWAAGGALAGQPMDRQAVVDALASGEPAVRIEAAARLVEVDLAHQPRLLRAAVAAMRDSDEEVRFLAVSAVAATAYTADAAPSGAFEPAMNGLIERLNDPADRVRAAAADALALLGTPPRATADLLDAVDTSSSAAVRRAAIGALATLPVVEGAVRDALIETVRSDPESTVRGEAAKALAALRLDDDEAIAALRGALGDRDVYVQQNAAGALGMLGDRAGAAVPDLRALAGRSSDETVRRQVGYALRSILGESAGEREVGRPAVRSATVEAEVPAQPAGSPPPG
jgi:HEAT repeat protein